MKVYRIVAGGNEMNWDLSVLYQGFDDPAFAHLIDATYALIGHEIAATENIEAAMFSEKTKKEHPDLEERIAFYKSKVLG